MDYPRQFTNDEDVTIWKLAIKEKGRKQLSDAFRESMELKRSVEQLQVRFRRYLLPHLPKTKFHPATKLKLYQTYLFPIEPHVLKELRKDAVVYLDTNGLITSYELKPGLRKNDDMELNDEDFLKITMPIVPKKKHFTPDEDEEIWKHVFKRPEKFSRGSIAFFKKLGKKLNRAPKGLLVRFVDHLSHQLHTVDAPVETALQLYKRCHIPVDKEYLKELEKHADLVINENGRITWYKLKNRKRKNTEKHGGKAKRARKNESDDEDSDQEEDESTDEEEDSTTSDYSGRTAESENDEEPLIVENVVPGTVSVKRKIALKKESINRKNITIPVEEPVITRAVITPARVRHAKIEVVEPEIYAENEVGFAAEEEVVDQEKEDQRTENEAEVVREEVVEQEQSASVEKWKEVMQRIEEKIGNQETINRTNIAESKKDLEAVFEEKLAKMKAELEVSFETKMMKVMSHGMKVIQNEIKTIKNDNGNSEDEAASKNKKYLQNLKNLVTSLGSPETAGIEQKIETALQKLPENDEKPIPMSMLHGVLELALSLVNP